MSADSANNTNTAKSVPVIAVHGGAWDWADELDEPKLVGLRVALATGHEALARGGSAVEAVERAVRSLPATSWNNYPSASMWRRRGRNR